MTLGELCDVLTKTREYVWTDESLQYVNDALKNWLPDNKDMFVGIDDGEKNDNNSGDDGSEGLKYGTKEWDEAWRGFYRGDNNRPHGGSGMSKQDICEHEYKQYTGLTESYEYCEHCDEKRKKD